MPSIPKKTLVLIVTPIICVALIVLSIIVIQYRKVSKELTQVKNNPSSGQLTDERQRELIQEVGSKIMLPSDEKPTVAVVSDISRLKDQQFFSGGQNGDVVLIYMNARRAILYRPQDKKIVEVAPVNLSPNQQASVAGTATQDMLNPGSQLAPTSVPQQSTGVEELAATFALRNGTQITGLARTFETDLTKQLPKAVVTERGNAAKRTYTQTMIVDVKGTKAAELTQIAQKLGITVGTMPSDEPTTSSDFLIILANDR